MSGRVAIRKRRQNRLGMLLVTVVVLMLLLVVAVKCMELKQKQEIYLTREAQLQEQIDEQEARADEIEEFRKYTKTKKYAEEVAKDKLGLVNEDKIIFKEE